MRVPKKALRFAQAAMLLALVAALGCEKSSTGPTTADFNEQREELKARVAQSKERHPAPQQAAAPSPVSTVPEAAEGATAPMLASGGTGYVYDPTGKRDPFRNFMWERPDRLREQDLQGPLEQFDLSQLALIAVVWKTGTARALVQDPSGESYIIAEGSRIGRNEGLVLSIDDGLVVVKETYVDYLGQETTKDIEMRMRRNEGG
jgi:type IV pilus assembly protein PilP